MKCPISPIIILRIAFTPLVASSVSRYGKTPLALALDGNNKLATECHMETFTVPSLRANVLCWNKCHDDLKGYINNRGELICYTQSISAVRVSEEWENCTCGYPKPVGYADRNQDCFPKLSFEKISNSQMCTNACSNYIAIRLRKYKGVSYTIWCEEKLIEERKRKLDYSLDIKSGIGSDNLEFYCKCGLRNEYVSIFRIQNPAFNIIENETDHSASTSCSQGPFWIHGEKKEACDSFCGAAKGYFSPNSNQLICYHNVKTGSAIPPSLSTNPDVIPSEIICECGGFFENGKDHDHYSPCVPKRKHVKPKEIPVALFQRGCERYCSKLVVFFVDSYPTPKVVGCSLNTELSQPTLSRLDFKIIRSRASDRPKLDAILCECGVAKLSRVKNKVASASSSRRSDYNDDKFFDDILNDLHPKLPLEVPSVNHSTSTRNIIKQKMQTGKKHAAGSKKTAKPMQVENQSIQPIFPPVGDFIRPSPTCEHGTTFVESPSSEFNKFRTTPSPSSSNHQSPFISSSQSVSSSLLQIITTPELPVVESHLSSPVTELANSTTLENLSMDAFNELQAVIDELRVVKFKETQSSSTHSPSRKDGLDESSLDNIDFTPISSTRSISSSTWNRRSNETMSVSSPGCRSNLPSQTCQRRTTFPSLSPDRNDEFNDHLVGDIFNELTPIISSYRSVSVSQQKKRRLGNIRPVFPVDYYPPSVTGDNGTGFNELELGGSIKVSDNNNYSIPPSYMQQSSQTPSSQFPSYTHQSSKALSSKFPSYTHQSSQASSSQFPFYAQQLSQASSHPTQPSQTLSYPLQLARSSSYPSQTSQYSFHPSSHLESSSHSTHPSQLLPSSLRPSQSSSNPSQSSQSSAHSSQPNKSRSLE